MEGFLGLQRYWHKCLPQPTHPRLPDKAVGHRHQANGMVLCRNVVPVPTPNDDETSKKKIQISHCEGTKIHIVTGKGPSSSKSWDGILISVCLEDELNYHVHCMVTKDPKLITNCLTNVLPHLSGSASQTMKYLLVAAVDLLPKVPRPRCRLPSWNIVQHPLPNARRTWTPVVCDIHRGLWHPPSDQEAKSIYIYTLHDPQLQNNSTKYHWFIMTKGGYNHNKHILNNLCLSASHRIHGTGNVLSTFTMQINQM